MLLDFCCSTKELIYPSIQYDPEFDDNIDNIAPTHCQHNLDRDSDKGYFDLNSNRINMPFKLLSCAENTKQEDSNLLEKNNFLKQFEKVIVGKVDKNV